MGETDTKALERELHDLVAALQGTLKWKWDARFGTAVAEFPAEKQATVLGILDRYLSSRWNSTSIADAPEVVKKVREHLGGLMAGQLLLLSDPDAGTLVYCAWWPWGNEQTISVRIGVFCSGCSDEERKDLTSVFRGWFKV
jgi:hypothetical protein